jgi:hypothetical protein
VGRKFRPEVETLEDRRVPAVVTNPVSHFPITVDGQFDTGGEWSDVTPLSFRVQPNGMLQALPTLQTPGVGNPNGNSFLYTTLAPKTVGGPLDDELYLMYDEVASGNQSAAPAGTHLADITFPIVINGAKEILGVHVVATAAPSFFDVFFDINGVPQPAGSLEVHAAAGNHPSPNSPMPHLIVELEVSLRIQPGFASPGSPIPAAGINPDTGMYSPDPQFWTGSFPPAPGKQPGDPLGTSALFQINPDGSVIANSDTIVRKVVKIEFRKDHPVNLKSNGLLPIEIPSTPTFDATKIDPRTVKINGVSLPPESISFTFGKLKMEYHVQDLVRSAALKKGDTSLVLTATTFDGTTVGGSGVLDIVPPM